MRVKTRLQRSTMWLRSTVFLHKRSSGFGLRLALPIGDHSFWPEVRLLISNSKLPVRVPLGQWRFCVGYLFAGSQPRALIRHFYQVAIRSYLDGTA